MTRAIDSSARRSPSAARSAAAVGILFGAAFGAALALAILLNAGPRLHADVPTLALPGSALTTTRGSGHVDGARFVLDRTDADAIAIVAAAPLPFAAIDYPRVTWQITSNPRRGVQLDMVWRTRERPGTTFSAPIDWSHGPAFVDLLGKPDWSGTIDGIALAVRGRLVDPLAVDGVTLRSSAWDATLADVVGAWATPVRYGGRSIAAPNSEQEIDPVPLLTVVAGAIALGAAVAALLARRRGLRLAPAFVGGLFLAGWLVLDLRWQANLFGQEAAAVALYAGRTDDAKAAAGSDGALFALARRIRDADRPRPARVLVLSNNRTLRVRLGWFLYPDNVYYDGQAPGAARAPAPDALRPGDQVVLLLYDGIAWDPSRGLLVWRDGRTRAAREILADGSALAVVRVE